MYKLGYTFDLGPVAVPVDLSGGAVTGKRVNLRNASSVNFVVFKGLEAGTDDPVFTIQQHKVSSAGTPIALTVDHYWKKSAVTLAGTESWVKVAQAASATVTLTSEAANQGIYVIEINTKDLTDGYGYVSLNSADAGSTAQIGGVLALLSDLNVRRDPANLQPTLF